MKSLVNLSRILVGVLFIFSGFIKLNDPIGFAFKLEEYFGPTVLDLPFFIPYALGISIIVVVFEVLLVLLFFRILVLLQEQTTHLVCYGYL